MKDKTETGVESEILKLNNNGMYTWLLNSMDKDFKKYLTQNVGTHEQQGPLAWKLITEHLVKSKKQAICRAICKIHTLEQFDFDINQLIDVVLVNKEILESCG